MINYKYAFIFLVALVSQSCGLKVTSEISDNVLLGKWQLDYVDCFASVNDNTLVEQFQFKTSNHELLVEFDGSDFIYEVSSTADPTCSTTAYSKYSTEFDGDSVGYIDFSDITSSGSCSLDLTDTGPDTLGNITVAMAMLPSNSENIYWLYDGTNLYMELPVELVGTNEDFPGCDSNCFCRGFFNEI